MWQRTKGTSSSRSGSFERRRAKTCARAMTTGGSQCITRRSTGTSRCASGCGGSADATRRCGPTRVFGAVSLRFFVSAPARRILQVGLQATSHDGWQPLHAAAHGGHLDVIRWMVNRGASATAVTNDGWTALHAAAHGGHLAVVTWLVEHGASIRERAMNGEEPLSLAAMSGQHEVVDFLVRAWVLQSGASSEPEDGSSLPRGLAETLPPQQIEELERLMTPRGEGSDQPQRSPRGGHAPAGLHTPRILRRGSSRSVATSEPDSAMMVAAAAAPPLPPPRRGESVPVAPPPAVDGVAEGGGGTAMDGSVGAAAGAAGPASTAIVTTQEKSSSGILGAVFTSLFSGADAAAAAAEAASPAPPPGSADGRTTLAASEPAFGESIFDALGLSPRARAEAMRKSKEARGAIVIQCTVRRWQARRVLETKLTIRGLVMLMANAERRHIRLIQRSYRAHLEAKTRSAAALRMQAVSRTRSGRLVLSGGPEIAVPLVLAMREQACGASLACAAAACDRCHARALTARNRMPGNAARPPLPPSPPRRRRRFAASLKARTRGRRSCLRSSRPTCGS